VPSLKRPKDQKHDKRIGPAPAGGCRVSQHGVECWLIQQGGDAVQRWVGTGAGWNRTFKIVA